MKLMKKIREKISSKKAFSLSELLMALLVVSIMTVALTAGVSASLRVYNESIRHAEERTLLSTVAEAVMSELRNAREIKTDTNGTVSFTSLNYGPGVSFKVDSGKMKIGSGEAWNDLIGNGSYIKDKISLKAEDTSITYNKTTGVFSVRLVCAGSEETRDFSIRPMTGD